MHLTLQQMMNGLTPEHELFFRSRPDDPQMRESTSIWLFEENGAFGFPRIGIEAEAHSWDNRLYHANFNLGGGRVLHDSGRGSVPSSIGPDGRATIFGAGPLTFRCVEPFRKWFVSFDGTAIEGTIACIMRISISGAVESCTTPGAVPCRHPSALTVAQLPSAQVH